MNNPAWALPPAHRLAEISDDVASTLRDRFRALGYDEQVLSVAGDFDEAAHDALRLPLARAILEQRGDPRSLVALVFSFAGVASASRLREALGDEVCAALVAAEILRPTGSEDGLRSTYRVALVEGLWIFADHRVPGAEVIMLPAGGAARLLRVMPKGGAGAVLDVGCGSGVLALVAARRGASRAVGTDLNARAVEVSRWNARLNGIPAEFHVGDRVAPVAGERFDLVVAQPPYVIRPAEVDAVTYLHGGDAGDELALRFLADIPAVLAPGGRALVTFDTAERTDAPTGTRVREALGDAVVDLVLLIAPGPTLDRQKVGYASLAAPDLGPAFEAAVRHYHGHYQSLGLERFSQVLAVLRKREGEAIDKVFVLSLTSTFIANGDPRSLDAFLAAVDLARRDDRTLLASAVRCSPDGVWLDERPVPDPRTKPLRAVRFSVGQVAQDRNFEEGEYVLLSELHAAASVGEAVERFATAARSTPDAVRAGVLRFVRQGLTTGLLEPRQGQVRLQEESPEDPP